MVCTQCVCCRLDSQVALGALVKGRSSSKALNKELQRSLRPTLRSDIYGYHVYFDTKYNPADDPTRDHPLRRPELPLPPWWTPVCRGFAPEFDQWLRFHGAATDYADVDFGELCGGQAVDIRAQKAARRDPLPEAAHVHPECLPGQGFEREDDAPSYDKAAYDEIKTFQEPVCFFRRQA